jgi:hypothetical protein
MSLILETVVDRFVEDLSHWVICGMAVVRFGFRVRPPRRNSKTKRFPLVGFPSRAARLPNSEVPAGSRERQVLHFTVR